MKVLPFLLLAFIPIPLHCQDPALSDNRDYWSVGIVAFEGSRLSRENVYLSQSFPLLLRERLAAIPSHFFSEREVQAYRRGIIRRRQRSLADAVQKERRRRDELFFDPEARPEQITAIEQRIDSNLDELRRLGEMDPAQIPFPESRSLRFASGEGGRLIFDQLLLSPLDIAAKNELDILIWGRLEQIQDFLYLEIHLLHAQLEEQVFSYSDAATPAELYERVDELVAQMASILWGRDWSSLRVESDPAGASVWIDGSFRGRAPLEIPYLLPGKRELRVQATGYEDVLRTIELSPYERELQQLSLSAVPEDLLTVNSEPDGAAVYDGSEWLGITPLSVQKPQTSRRYLLRREGYLDLPVYTGQDPETSIIAELLPADLDPAAMQDRRRKELYRAFGAFALSIPAPLFLWGYGYDYRVLAAQPGSPPDAERTADTLTYLSLGTIAVSGSLFVNLMVRLVRYLRAADRKA